MNKIFGLCWSRTRQTFVVVAENVRSCSKRSIRCAARQLTGVLLAGGLGSTAFAGTLAEALPANGSVVAGSATVSTLGQIMNINQSTQKVVIDWEKFSIGNTSKVNFNQPSVSAVALNRVTGNEQTLIDGVLNANGKVFILNSSGILFSKNSSVNTSGLVASTMSLSNADFLADNYKFSGNGSTSAVVNAGNINIANGGYAALLGQTVSNQGTINAKLGTVALASGNRVSLQFDNHSLVNVTVDQPTLNALVENKQAIYADGGTIILTAKAIDAVLMKVVNNEGLISAQSIKNQNGRVFLDGGESGVVVQAGRIDVSSPDGVGGHTAITGDKVLLANASSVDASGVNGGGNVHIGGGWHGDDSTIRNASAVVMGPDATIDVSAKDNGNAGTAVLWSQDYTGFYGSIVAHGGQSSGNGGRVETSSHNNLQALGNVNASTVHGASGLWLLDPRDVTIAGDNASGTTYSAPYTSFTPTADSTILASNINTALNAGSNVTITTGSSGTSAGNITVSAPIAKTGGGPATLTLSAANNINVNQAISSSSGRLNVVLTADSDNVGGGSLDFGAAGHVVTNDGNFYIGSIAGVYDTLTSKGQDVTMASGSYINVGQGMLGVAVNGNIQLPDNSGQTTTYALTSSFNSGYRNYVGGGSLYYYQSPSQALTLFSASGAITTSNSNASIADIVTSVNTSLSAGTIGSAGAPIKIAGAPNAGYNNAPESINYRFPSYAQTLYLTNTGTGGTYVNEINKQIFSTISLSTATATSGTQNIQIMGDAGGNGTTGTGHIIATGDGSGTLAIGPQSIDTAGKTGTSTLAGAINASYYEFATDASQLPVFPTSVVLTAPTIALENNSTYAAVNTGPSVTYRIPYSSSSTNYTSANYSNGYYSSLSATGSTAITAVNAADSKAEIKSLNLTLSGTNIGTATHPIEIAAGTSLNAYNTGGSTYIKSVDNNFNSITLQSTKNSGVHEILFSNGDHINVASDGSDLNIGSLSARSDGSTFGASTGIDLTGNNRQLTLNARTGGIIFDDNAVNTGRGNFTVQIDASNSNGVIAAKKTYDASASVAQIRAANVELDVYSANAPGTIGANGKDIQIAQGVDASNNTLTVYTQKGNVNIHELTSNHFKTLNMTLNGSSASQTVAIDLNGPDDVNFSDANSLVILDATKVNLSANNRNWNLQTPSRIVQINGNSLGTGYYTVGASQIKLNSDVMTNGGAISLTGNSAVSLLSSARIDSNADDVGNATSTGTAGSISVSGPISATAAGRTLTVDSSSTSTSGGSISLWSNTANGTGAYLSGLTLTSKGSATNNDGQIWIYGQNYLLNGDFRSTGMTDLVYPTTIDTEQGNLTHAGNIAFDGYSLTSRGYYSYAFNANTTGGSGGNVDLYGTVSHNEFLGSSISINTSGGGSASAGSIALPAMTSTYSGNPNTQSYTGGVITLYGNLTTDKGAVSLTGDVRLANNVTIDTWATAGTSQTGNAGSVVFNGAGISATGPGKTLTIDTSAVTPNNEISGSGYYSTSSAWAQSGGAVTVKTNTLGSYALDALSITTTSGGSHNTGNSGTMSLGGVTTTSAQTYAGGGGEHLG